MTSAATADAAPRPRAAARLNYPLLALGGIMAIASIAILHAGRGTLPFFDEWNIIIERRGHSLDTLLRPHNGHLILAPMFPYKALLQVAGIDHYWPFRLAVVIGHLVVGAGVFVLARRRVGDWGAVAAAGAILFCFSASDDLVWAAGLGTVMAVGFGVWMLVGLDRDDRWGDVLACLCLIGAFASLAVGVPYVIAAAIIVGWDRRRWRRAWVVAIPVVLYLLWYAGYAEGGDIKSGNLSLAPRYSADLASNAIGGIIGLGIDYGRPLLLVLLAAVVLRFAVPRRVGPWIVALVATAVGLWGLTALARADLAEPLAGRYIYPGAVLMVLLTVELLRGRRLPPAAIPATFVLLAIAGLGNYGVMTAYATQLRLHADALKARLGALALVADRVPAQFHPVPQEDPVITAKGAAEAQKDFGRIALGPQQLPTASESQRAAADAVLLSAAEVQASPAAAVTGSTPTIASVQGASVRAAGSCRRIVPTGPGTGVDLTLRGGRSLVMRSAAAVPVYLRRFSGAFTGQPAVVLGAGDATRITAAPDVSVIPWIVAARPTAPLTVCAG